MSKTTKTATKDAPLLDLTANEAPAPKLPATTARCRQTKGPANPPAKPPNQGTGGRPAAQQPTDADDFLQAIMRAAADKNVDVAKMKELLAMRKELEAERREREWFVAFHAAKARMPTIIKDGKNPETKSSYPRLESISTKVDPIAQEHGFSATYGTADSPLANHYRVVCDLLHVGGHARRYCADIPIDTTGAKGTKNKSDTHGAGSAISYGRRYIKVLMWDLVIAGEDTDAAKKAPAAQQDRVSVDQADRLRDLVEAVGADGGEFIAYMNKNFSRGYWLYQSIDDLPAKLFDEAVRQLNSYGKTHGKVK